MLGVATGFVCWYSRSCAYFGEESCFSCTNLQHWLQKLHIILVTDVRGWSQQVIGKGEDLAGCVKQCVPGGVFVLLGAMLSLDFRLCVCVCARFSTLV